MVVVAVLVVSVQAQACPLPVALNTRSLSALAAQHLLAEISVTMEATPYSAALHQPEAAAVEETTQRPAV